MKRALSSLALACLLVSMIGAAGAHAQVGGMYDDAIDYVRDAGIAHGYPDGSFRPDLPINRAEFSKIIMMAAEGDEEMDGAYCFHDVRNEWFAPYVCTARDHGMIAGYGDGTFRPAQSVTFAEASSLVAKAYHGTMASGGAWYTPYVHQLDEWDAIPPTVRSVHDPLTRGEMAYIIMMADHAHGREDDKDHEDDRDDEPDLDIAVHALREEAAPGESVTFIIEIENDGGEEPFDIEARLDSDFTLIDAPGHDELHGRTVIWENISMERGDEASFVLVARIDSGAAAGRSLVVDVEASNEEASAAMVVRHGTTNNPVSPVGDPVLYWNAIALQANADDHTGIYGAPEQGGPTWASRALAIVHAAIYEALNSVDQGHEPYIALIPVQPHEHVDLDAAVAAAAHRALVDLYPRQAQTLDASYQSHLQKIPAGSGKEAGLRVGEAAAAQILAARENDGSKKSYAHVPSDQPGKHRPDPLNPEQDFLGAKWGAVKPFVLAASWQFRADPPPGIDSPAYAAAFNEVKMMGGDGVHTPTARSAEQTEIGLFWAYDGTKQLGTPNRLYNQIARVIALQRENSIVENARFFALVNLAIADAGIGAWESKYHYDVWRPIVGIREADAGTGPTGAGDGNPLTAGDAQWTPLGSPMSNMTMTNFTPPFPSYPSGHSTFGTAFFRVVEQYYGTDEIAFTFTSDEMNGVTTDNRGVVRPLSPRTFANLRDAARENSDSRVYLGVHWRFDQDAGMTMGNRIGEYVFEHALRPVR